ncbi:MAG: hypothetical protein ACOH5I_04225 [Oligoflexus sp.]
MRIFSLIISLSFFTLGCEESSSNYEPVQESNTASGQQTDDDQQTIERPARERRDPRFYPMTGERPSEVCGEAGFEYIWRGFLLKECGTCHFTSNRFGVTEFAERTNLEGSYQVMASQVDRQEFVHAITENPLCIKCILHEEDPLRADIVYFTEHITSCESE